MIGFLKQNNLLNEKGAHAITDVFHLDSLDVTTNLEPHQILTIIAENSITELANVDKLSDIIFRYRFLNAGGTEETPASEIIAFSFLLFTQDSFNYHAEIKKIMVALGFTRILNFIEAEGIAIPSMLVLDTAKMLGDELWLALTDGKKFEVDNDATPFDVMQFMKNLTSRDSVAKRELYAIFSNLNITGSLGNDERH